MSVDARNELRADGELEAGDAWQPESKWQVTSIGGTVVSDERLADTSGPKIALVVVAALCVVLGLSVVWRGDASDTAAGFWPPAGVGFVAMLVVPTRRWGWVVLGIMGPTFVGVAFSMVPWQASVWWTLANVVEPAFAALLLRRCMSSQPISSNRRMVLFLCIAVLLAPMIGGVIGAIGTLAGGLAGLVWAGIRFGTRAVASAGFVVALGANVAAAQGYGPFAEGNGYSDVDTLQIFLAIALITSFVVAALASDLADRDEVHRLLTRQATHDALTGLPNRVLLGQRLNQALQARDRTGQAVAVLMIDLDDFKKINDEITETAVMDDLEVSARVLEVLAQIGVQLSLDDFGTGYSSLTHLRRIPVNTLKIDRSFVDGLGAIPEDTAIVESIINLGHSFGIQIVAEGNRDHAATATSHSARVRSGAGLLVQRSGRRDVGGEADAPHVRVVRPAGRACFDHAPDVGVGVVLLRFGSGRLL